MSHTDDQVTSPMRNPIAHVQTVGGLIGLVVLVMLGVVVVMI